MNNNNKTSANKIQKVAIVTGSSSGIGRTAAIALAKEGIKVVIAARRDKEGEETIRLVKESDSDGIFVKTEFINWHGNTTLHKRNKTNHMQANKSVTCMCESGLLF